MYDKQQFASQLDVLLERRGLKQREFAAMLDTAETSVSRYVRGGRVPDLETLVAMADILHVSIGGLLGVEPDGEDALLLTRCYAKASDADRSVIWALLDRYLTDEEREAVRDSRTGGATA